MSLCPVANSRLTACNPCTVAHRAPLFIFSRQEYWSELPFPPPGHLPDPGIKLTSRMFPALAGRFFTTTPYDFYSIEVVSF